MKAFSENIYFLLELDINDDSEQMCTRRNMTYTKIHHTRHRAIEIISGVIDSCTLYNEPMWFDTR
jgi:hypothetical protein